MLIVVPTRPTPNRSFHDALAFRVFLHLEMIISFVALAYSKFCDLLPARRMGFRELALLLKLIAGSQKLGGLR